LTRSSQQNPKYYKQLPANCYNKKQWHGKEAKETKCKRVVIYWTARLLTLAIFCALTFAAYQFISLPHWLYSKFEEYQGALFIALITWFWNWSGKSAALVCRLCGLSLERTQTESITRGNNLQSQPPLKPLVIGRNGAQFIFPICFTGLSYIFGSSLFVSVENIDNTWWVLAVVFLISSVTAIFSWINVAKPMIKADANGIQYCDLSGLSCKFIAWNQIYCCDVIQVYDALGKVVKNSIVLKDARHKKLLTISFTTSSNAINYRNTRRLQKFIERTLP